MSHQITLEDAAGQLPQLAREAQGGREVVLLDGFRPVARILPLAEDTPSSEDMALLAVRGGAFDWLAGEPEPYDDTCGEAIP